MSGLEAVLDHGLLWLAGTCLGLLGLACRFISDGDAWAPSEDYYTEGDS